LCSSVVERGEPHLVADDQVVAQQQVDDPADAVVGQAAVEGFDQAGGGEVADSMPGVDGGVPERDEQVALAGATRYRRFDLDLSVSALLILFLRLM
jgi:hypothetical protein